jgi:hypothetical protein
MLKFSSLNLILLVLISCDQQPESDILPYGYYKDTNWSNLELFELKGQVKSRTSFCTELYAYSHIKKDRKTKLYHLLKFDKNGFLTFEKGSNWTANADTTTDTYTYYYPESVHNNLYKIVRNNSNETIFTWDQNNRIQFIKYRTISDGISHLSSMNKYEYLGQTSFCTKESKFDENGILTSYVDFFFDTHKNYLGWDQYWSAQLSGPMRLAESYKIKYNKNKKPIATSSYEHFYDSLEPKTHFEHLYLNGHNQPINYDEYNRDSTKVISSTRFKYDDNERLIYREYRHKKRILQ